MSHRAVIIVAGGTGTRMGAPVAKQFLPLAGKPVLLHTFRAFAAFDPAMQFVLVLFPSLLAQWQEIAAAHHFELEHNVVHGGAERFHSVKAGLAALRPQVQVVAIHDAVRPLVSHATLERCFAAAESHGTAIPAVPVTDTIRRISPGHSTTLPRHELLAVQTPQCFRRSLIDRAYEVAYQPLFTDDASVVEHAGHPVHIVAGNRTNIKLTTPEDLVIAETLIRSRF